MGIGVDVDVGDPVKIAEIVAGIFAAIVAMFVEIVAIFVEPFVIFVETFG